MKPEKRETDWKKSEQIGIALQSVFIPVTILLFFLILPIDAYTQEGIKTINNASVEDLINDVFIKGNCRNVSNISSIGSTNLSIGQFDGGEEIFGFNDGVIISTGDISLAEGPNLSLDAGHSFNNESVDPDLSQIATGTLFDVTGIEFDFIPIENKVSFRYVFASEEYCEFVGTTFNDVFGFFVSGPGIDGPFQNNAINVATISGTDVNVSINNVNHLDNEALYVNNATTDDVQNCQINYNAQFQELIEYDGFTVEFTASFDVIPCETYHIRLVIADVADAMLDSAVFLESKSFDLGEKVNIHVEVPGTDQTIAYEDCVDGQFVFTRNNLSSLNQDCVVDYIIDPQSQAVNGVDFEEIPLSITIPAGDTSVALPINIISDAIAEGPENLNLTLQYECDCINPRLSQMTIDENTGLMAIGDSLTVCADQYFFIHPEIIEGIPPFSFDWENGSFMDSLELIVSDADNYTITITDLCSNTTSVEYDIGIQSSPTATLNGTYDFCEIQNLGIPVFLEGNPPWSIDYSINGSENISISNIDENPFFLEVFEKGTYSLTAFSDAFCKGDVSGSAVVTSNFTIDTNIISPSCVNSFDGIIEITSIDGVTPFNLEWNYSFTDSYFLENLNEGIYSLSILDGDGCIHTFEFELIANSQNLEDCIIYYVPNIFSPNNDGINDVFSVFFKDQSGVILMNSLQVYNRWGELVFETKDVVPNTEHGWNGMFKNKSLNPDVFVYFLTMTLDDNSIFHDSGNITLIR